ncbi:MAG: hypothetical protein WBR26_24900 [Candidatus Acidiferrum sp.]
MSNQIGDRYTCSDTNCGCEVEIQRPCNSGETASTTEPSGTGVRPTGYEYRHGQVSTEDDFGGTQGATGEGTFGTVGGGDRSALASGRYDTESTRLHQARPESDRTLTCFCGSKMRQLGSNHRAQVAQFGSSNR